MIGEIKTRRRERPDEKYAPAHLLSISPSANIEKRNEEKKTFLRDTCSSYFGLVYAETDERIEVGA